MAFELGVDGLSTTVKATLLSGGTAPFGAGSHPYLVAPGWDQEVAADEAADQAAVDEAARTLREAIDALERIGQGPEIPVERIEIAGPILMQLRLGEAVTLSAVVTPEEAADAQVIWSSLNEDVVRVDENGAVTAVRVGTTRVTATSGAKSASVTIRVSA